MSDLELLQKLDRISQSNTVDAYQRWITATQPTYGKPIHSLVIWLYGISQILLAAVLCYGMIVA